MAKQMTNLTNIRTISLNCSFFKDSVSPHKLPPVRPARIKPTDREIPLYHFLVQSPSFIITTFTESTAIPPVEYICKVSIPAAVVTILQAAFSSCSSGVFSLAELCRQGTLQRFQDRFKHALLSEISRHCCSLLSPFEWLILQHPYARIVLK